VSSASTASGEPRHFATLWEAIADEIPSAPALTHGGRTIAWGEFEQRAARLAGALRAAADRQLDASDVIAAARRRLAGYKVPRLVVFADDVPRAPNGKVDYPAVEAVLAGQHGAGGQCQLPRPPRITGLEQKRPRSFLEVS
jgi:acyl-CoA synthetase (AMP-forming)/AMP-acid ligase II